MKTKAEALAAGFVPVVCSRCDKTRYAKPPLPTVYVCKRCLALEGPKSARPAESAAPVTKPAGDPFYSDLARRAEINARASRKAPAWIPKRKGWLR